ncbi:MAG: hypothetical protein AAGA56_18375 [Myxococcota bacterium]
MVSVACTSETPDEPFFAPADGELPAADGPLPNVEPPSTAQDVDREDEEPADDDDAPSDDGEEDEDPGDDPVCDFSAVDSCAAPVADLVIDADHGEQRETVHGTTDAFIRVYAREDAVWPPFLSMSAELTSPPGTKFDMVVYAESRDEPMCDGEPDAVVRGGDTRFSASWLDTLPAYADDYYFVFEIRHVSGDCDNGSWSLDIEGNVTGGWSDLTGCTALDIGYCQLID